MSIAAPETIHGVERLLTEHEVAAILGRSRKWVMDQARSGELKSLQMGKFRRFRTADVEAFIEKVARRSA